jgi:hypothetical protein
VPASSGAAASTRIAPVDIGLARAGNFPAPHHCHGVFWVMPHGRAEPASFMPWDAAMRA